MKVPVLMAMLLICLSSFTLADERTPQDIEAIQNFDVDGVTIGMTLSNFKRKFPEAELKKDTSNVKGVETPVKEFYVLNNYHGSDKKRERRAAGRISLGFTARFAKKDGKEQLVYVEAIYSNPDGLREIAPKLKKVLGTAIEDGSPLSVYWDLSGTGRAAWMNQSARRELLIATARFVICDEEFADRPKQTNYVDELTDEQIKGIQEFSVSGIRIGMSLDEMRKLFPMTVQMQIEVPDNIKGAAEKWCVNKSDNPQVEMLASSVEVTFIDGVCVGIFAFYGPDELEMIVKRCIDTFGIKNEWSKQYENSTVVRWEFKKFKRDAMLMVTKKPKAVLIKFTDGTPYFETSKGAKNNKSKF